ncbi:VOC family protein [Alphaproteobacteria bacterium KMM 3653]|uniref:VOC family protein n=1 Tax=Harenicola maris TaxID=2841044 RepID=A0AAP2G2V0_9RHOB|nr:VOC family protein [Harenicola maris]
MEFDHLAVAGESLEEAAAYVEEALGLPLSAGGEHGHFGTHNRLMSLGPEEYLEAIAIDPAAGALPYARWFDLDRFTGPARLSNWICRVDDIAAIEPEAGAPVPLSRGAYHWTMAVPQDGVLPYDNCHPALMQWQGPHPAPKLPDVGARLERLVVSHPEAQMLAKSLPLYERRVVFEAGPAALRAEIRTPHGLRVLE